ncbi:hypothetical protein GF389_00505 [Candidatus Dojkabacteria bacterium]|nr:hypothetical protein [Candidatus Dojkabacteria bacterium]
MFKTIKTKRIPNFELYDEKELEETLRLIKDILGSQGDREELKENRLYYENLERLFAFLFVLYTEKKYYHSSMKSHKSKLSVEKSKETLDALSRNYNEFKEIAPVYFAS